MASPVVASSGICNPSTISKVSSTTLELKCASPSGVLSTSKMFTVIKTLDTDSEITGAWKYPMSPDSNESTKVPSCIVDTTSPIVMSGICGTTTMFCEFEKFHSSDVAVTLYTPDSPVESN